MNKFMVTLILLQVYIVLLIIAGLDTPKTHIVYC